MFADNGSGADTDVDSGFAVTAINGVGITDGQIITLASGALLTIGLDGTFDYDPNGQFEALAAGAAGSDSFTYTIDDGAGGMDTGAVSLTIDGVNDAPVGGNPPAPPSILFGTNLSDVLEGSGDHDEIRGLADADLISGLGGNDKIKAGAGNDRARGGEGYDRIVGGGGDEALFGDGGDDTLSGGSGNDRLLGQSGNDKLSGGGGDDVLSGARGDDTLRAGGGDDTLSGGADNDNLSGQNGDDKLGGGRGDDELSGGNGADRIRGGSGEDILTGGRGNDNLIGGNDDDVFRFSSNDGQDVIRGFQQDGDLIEITGGAAGFSAIGISQVGQNVQLSFGATTIIAINQTASEFSEDDFISKS